MYPLALNPSDTHDIQWYKSIRATTHFVELELVSMRHDEMAMALTSTPAFGFGVPDEMMVMNFRTLDANNVSVNLVMC